MPTIHLRLFQELNRYLPQEERAGREKQRFPVHVTVGTSVGAILKELNIPASVVDLVTADGSSVPLTFQPTDGTEITVYPVFERFEIGGLTRLRSTPLREPRFELDLHLGKLVRLLRLCGFDAEFRLPFDDQSLIDRSVAEQRILLSRDRAMIRRRRLTHGCLVHSTNPWEQLH